MATPFVGSMTIQYVDGEVDIVPLSASDVAAAFMTVSSTGLTFHTTKKKGFITDFNFGSAATVTSFNIWVNGKDTGNIYYFAALAQTVNNRVPSPLPIGGGVTLQLKQA